MDIREKEMKFIELMSKIGCAKTVEEYKALDAEITALNYEGIECDPYLKIGYWKLAEKKAIELNEQECRKKHNVDKCPCQERIDYDKKIEAQAKSRQVILNMSPQCPPKKKEPIILGDPKKIKYYSHWIQHWESEKIFYPNDKSIDKKIAKLKAKLKELGVNK